MSDLIDTTEMYLRTIFDLEEEGIPPLRARIAERLGHSGPTVSQTVARMERDGLLTVAGDRHIELSEEGRRRATRVMRKHRLAERLLVMSQWRGDDLDSVVATVVLVVVGLAIGLSIAPVNDAALADAPAEHHGLASSLVVVTRMIGMVVGLGLLTAVGLHRFYGTVQSLQNPSAQQVKDAGVVQVETVLIGAACAALVAAACALGLGRRPIRLSEEARIDAPAGAGHATDGEGGVSAAPEGHSKR